MPQAHAASRTLSRDGGLPLVINSKVRRAASNELAELGRTIEASLPKLRSCFKPATGPIRFRDGRLESDIAQLSRWLRARWNALKDGYDYPLATPKGTKPSDWEITSWCDTEIDIWAKFEHFCRLQKDLERLDANQIRLEWVTEPRIGLKYSWQRLLLAQGHIGAPPNHVFVIVTLSDLISRCLFSVCEKMQFKSSSSVEARVEDWNRTVASELEITGPSDSEIAAALVLGTGLLLPDRAVQALVHHRTGISVPLEHVRDLRNRLVDVHPDLSIYECRSVLDFRHRFQLIESPLTASLRRCAHELHVAAVTGNPTVIRKLFDTELNQPAREALFRIQEPRLTVDERADCLLAVPRRSAGRDHDRCRLSGESFEFLDLADEFRKHALAELGTRQGHFIFWHDQLVGLLPEKIDRVAIDADLCSMLTHCGQALLGSTPALGISWAHTW